MHVYLQAYQQGTDAAQPLHAYVTFYREEAEAFETAPIIGQETLANRLRTTPLKFQMSLDKLAPGEYICQVTVLAPRNRKAAFWRAPVMLVP